MDAAPLGGALCPASSARPARLRPRYFRQPLWSVKRLRPHRKRVLPSERESLYSREFHPSLGSSAGAQIARDRGGSWSVWRARRPRRTQDGDGDHSSRKLASTSPPPRPPAAALQAEQDVRTGQGASDLRWSPRPPASLLCSRRGRGGCAPVAVASGPQSAASGVWRGRTRRGTCSVVFTPQRTGPLGRRVVAALRERGCS